MLSFVGFQIVMIPVKITLGFQTTVNSPNKQSVNLKCYYRISVDFYLYYLGFAGIAVCYVAFYVTKVIA